MNSRTFNSVTLFTLCGILAMGLVACQNVESLAGQNSTDLLASAKSKLADSARLDSVACGSVTPSALFKHGDDDSIPEVHSMNEKHGCEDRVKTEVEKSRHDGEVHSSQGYGGDKDSLEIELKDGHQDREKCTIKTDSTHSEAGDDHVATSH